MKNRYYKFYKKFNRRWRKLIRHSKTVSDSGIRQTELPFKTGILRRFQKSPKINPGKNYPKNLTHFFVLAKVIRDL